MCCWLAQNLHFFLAVEQYRDMCRAIQHSPVVVSGGGSDHLHEQRMTITDLALRIYKTFISSTGKSMVNIDSAARKKLDDQFSKAAALTTPPVSSRAGSPRMGGRPLSTLERWTAANTAPVDENGNPIPKTAGDSPSAKLTAFEHLMSAIRADEKLFDDAQQNVFRLMSTDSFVRFRQNAKYINELKTSWLEIEEQQIEIISPLKKFNKATDAAVHVYCERAAAAGHFELAATLWDEGLNLFTRQNDMSIRPTVTTRSFIVSMENELRRIRAAAANNSLPDIKKETETVVKRMAQQKLVWCADFFTDPNLNPPSVHAGTSASPNPQNASANELASLLRFSAIRRLETLMNNARKLQRTSGGDDTTDTQSRSGGVGQATKLSQSGAPVPGTPSAAAGTTIGPIATPLARTGVAGAGGGVGAGVVDHADSSPATRARLVASKSLPIAITAGGFVSQKPLVSPSAAVMSVSALPEE